MLARSFHVRKNNERVLNARSVRNEQNVPNVRSEAVKLVFVDVYYKVTLPCERNELNISQLSSAL